MQTITVTQREMDRGIAGVLNRVGLGHTVVIVTRFSRAACVILPVAEYERLAGGPVQTSARNGLEELDLVRKAQVAAQGER